MKEFILNFHSTWAFIVVTLVVVSFISAAVGFFGKQAFNAKFKKIFLFTLIATHTQAMIGLVSYFYASGKTAEGYFKVEHLATMLLVAVLVTVGHVRFKKKPEFSVINFIIYFVATILLLARLPYTQWLG